MTAVAASYGATAAGDPVQLTAGYAAAFYGAAGIAVAGAGLLAVTFRPRAALSPGVDTAPSEPAPVR
jgi:hypothetical protein